MLAANSLPSQVRFSFALPSLLHRSLRMGGEWDLQRTCLGVTTEEQPTKYTLNYLKFKLAILDFLHFYTTFARYWLLA